MIHLASGDRWAGAEVQLFTLLSQLHNRPDIEVLAVLLNEGTLAQRLRERGISIVVLDESQLGSGTIVRRLAQLLRQYRPHVLHTHRQKENILGSFANFISIRARSVRTIHGASEHAPTRMSQRLNRALDKWTGNYLQQRVIAVSGDLATKLQRDFSPEKIVVIENGVDIASVAAAVRPVDFRLAAPDAVHIGIIGRLDPVKRIDIFLAMAQRLLQQQPNTPWHFHIFGEGALYQSLRRLAAELHLSGATTFHGHRSDMAACLAGLNAVVMCSDHEGLPMTALEAMAVGTPMLAHDVGGLSALLAGDAGGALVTDHSAIGYANALSQLLNKDRTLLKKNALKRLQQSYSAEANASRTCALYQTLYTQK